MISFCECNLMRHWMVLPASVNSSNDKLHIKAFFKKLPCLMRDIERSDVENKCQNVRTAQNVRR